MRLGYLCGEYPRATDTFIQREVAALRANGIKVTTIAVRRPAVAEQGSEEQEAERQQTRFLLPCSPWRLLIDHLGLLTASPARYFSSLWLALTVRAPGLRSLLYQLFYFAEAGLAAAHMRREGLTHLHNHAPDSSGYVTMIAARMGGFTYSLTLHGFGILSEPRRWRLTEKIKHALFCICVSWHARSQAMLWSSIDCWPRFHVVHCGVPTSPPPSRVHQGTGRRLLFVGRLDHVKGIPVLLDAVTQLQQQFEDIQVDLVGDGPERQTLEEVVRELGLAENVTFHGYRSQSQLRAHLDTCDVMVMSSFAEGIPVVLMEAMSHGLPCIAPRITGIPELLDHGVTGLLYTPGDAAALASTVAELLQDPDRRNELAARAHAFVQREFNLERETARFVQVVQARLAGQALPVRPNDVPAHRATMTPTETFAGKEVHT